MLSLPNEIIAVLESFAHEFSARIWERVVVLLVGAIVTPGKRTVSSALRVMGLQDEPHSPCLPPKLPLDFSPHVFQNYHRVPNRAVWAGRWIGQILLRLLVAAFVAPDEPVVVGIDETMDLDAAPGARALRSAGFALH